MRRFTITLLSLSLFLAACNGADTINVMSSDGKTSVPVKMEIADTPEEREQGLMNRKTLDADSGMLFVFTEPQKLEFWMKNTLIPLEILFFDANGDFVSAATMQPCKADPCPRYASAALANYALEVVPGFREKHGIGVGSTIDLKAVAKVVQPE